VTKMARAVSKIDPTYDSSNFVLETSGYLPECLNVGSDRPGIPALI